MSADLLESIFTVPRLKIERANSHVYNLYCLSQTPPPEIFELAPKPRNGLDAHQGIADLYFKPVGSIDEFYACIIGDAIHNFRVALSVLASNFITRLCGACARPTFPFNITREDLVTMPSYKAITETFPEAEALFLDEIKPYKTGNHKLWALSAIDNDDKYRVVPTVAGSVLSGTASIDRNFNFSIGDHGFDPSHEGYLFPEGTRIMVSEKQDDLKFTFSVSFSQDCLLGPELALEALNEISEIVTCTVDAFERLVRGNT